MQQLRGPGKRGVNILQLLIQLVKGGVCQGQVMLSEKGPVPAVQNAPRLIHPGQQMVVAAQQEQRPDGAPVSPGHLADLHLIQRGRNGAHAVLGEYQTQHPAELFPGQGGIPQKSRRIDPARCRRSPKADGIPPPSAHGRIASAPVPRCPSSCGTPCRANR